MLAVSDDDMLVWFAQIAHDLDAQRSEQAVPDRVVELTVQVIDGCDDAAILLLHRKQEVDTAVVISPRVHDSGSGSARPSAG